MLTYDSLLLIPDFAFSFNLRRYFVGYASRGGVFLRVLGGLRPRICDLWGGAGGRQQPSESQWKTRARRAGRAGRLGGCVGRWRHLV